MLGEQSVAGNQKIRESLKGVPGIGTLEMAEKAVSGWFAVQKSLIDVVSHKSAEFFDGVKDPNVVVSQSVTALGNLVRGSFQQTVAAQKAVLDAMQRH